MEALLTDLFKEFQKRVLTLWKAFSKESVRGMILIMTAEIDNLLVESLKRFIKPQRKKDSDDLFGRFGPLNSYGSRIEMAYRLGLISRLDADGLDQLRKLRNECAHTAKEFSLKEEPFRSQFAHFIRLTSERDDLRQFFGKIRPPKTDAEWVLSTCITYVIKLELRLRTLEQTPDRFYVRP